MSDTLSAMSKPQYRPSRRNWVKLWVNEWLTGTMRFQLSQEQRSLWADLLALAGASRIPGIICAGNTNGVMDGYPSDYLCGILRWQLDEFSKALALFKEQGRISVDSAGVIYILNWQKYQSEYHQKRNRAADKATDKNRFDKKSVQKSKSVSEMSTESRSLEVEVEVEVEGEGEGEKETSGAFFTFWSEYPRQEKKIRAKFAWFKNGLEERSAEVMASLIDWKRCEQWSDRKYIPYAVNWLDEGLWKQNPQNAARKLTKHEQARQITKSAVAKLRSEIENNRVG